MATAGERIYEWDRHPRIPVPPPPAGSCDCQFHIYDDPGKFPPRANPPYPPIESATFAQAKKCIRPSASTAASSSIARFEVRRSMARIHELGWHARLHVHGDDLLNNSDLLRSIKDVPMVIDHFGHVGFEGGFERAGYPVGTRHAQARDWWMMVSNGNRDSKMDAGWDDAIPDGKAFIEAAAQADDERRGGSRVALPLRRW